jgi:DNA-binding NtrC family response regulator
MRELYAMLERLARTDLTVLIEGDTGTGKEVAARALHELGRRKSEPFVVLDCTAIPPNLAESVLFGHEKGAFTGANERRIGLFEAAHGGTLFIDELGELPVDLQPKLLRVLERREVVAVGASKPRPVDVRIVSATWRDTRTLVNQGTFREDLYYRLAQARVRLPTLMERPEDIKPLVQHFLAKIPWDVEAARAITNEALESIATRSFPGNVRELKTTVERVAMLAEGATIGSGDLAFERILAVERGRSAPRGMRMSALPPQPGSQPGSQPQLPDFDDDAIEPFKEAKRTLIDDFEKGYLARLLARAGTNISRAASLAGIERQSLRDLLKKHGLRGEG